MADPISEAQLRQIYGATIDILYGFVSRRCGGERTLAEDVTQEVWLRAVRVWRQRGVPDKPIAWLTTVARNLILNELRRRPTVSFDEVSAVEVLAAVDANAVSESTEMAAVLGEALARIPEAEARLLESFHYDRFKMAQLAESYGISERAIEGRLRRARERLRREVELLLRTHRGLV